MPTRKALHKYPPEYKDLFRKVSTEGIVFIDAGSPERAHTMRKDLYNYRLALWEDTPRPPTEEDSRILAICDEITFKIRANQVIITKDASVYSSLIKSTLEKLADGT